MKGLVSIAVLLLVASSVFSQSVIGNVYSIYQSPGSNYTIHTNYLSNPNNTYTWYKDGIQITNNTSSLSLTNLQTTDSGEYTCQINAGSPNWIETAPITLIIAPQYSNCRLRDSLALVQIGQIAPTRHLWSVAQNMDKWKGVTLSDAGCVIGLSVTDDGINHISPVIGMLSDVENINLSKNIITGTIPAAIGSLSKLKYLDLSDNNINGSLPYELTTLSNLEGLFLSQNNLDEIPSEIGNLSSLIYLNVQYNELTSLPTEIGNLTQLKTLDISYNPLTVLPSGISQLTNLEKIYAQKCQLTTIPPEFANLTKLTQLELAENQLESLPSGLASSLINLNEVSFRLNYLTFEDLVPFAAYDFGYQNLIGIPDTTQVTLGSDFTIALDFDANVPDNTYIWSLDGISIDTTTENSLQITDFQTSNAGAYTCRVHNAGVPNFALSTASVSLVAEGDTIQEVIYPGDANADGIVNSTDILVWALAHDNAGVTRPSATAHWIAQTAPDWDSQVAGINGKHQDADGNGLIGEEDLDIIEINYRKNTGTHQQSYNLLNELKLSPNINAAQNFASSSEYEIELDLSSNIQGTTSLHGLAFTVDFSMLQHAEDYNAQVDESGSWIAPSKVISFKDASLRRSDFAITRTDLNNKIGIGNIGTLQVITTNLPTIQTPSFGIIIRDIRAIQSDGTIFHADDVFVGSFGSSNPEAFIAPLEFEALAYSATCDTPSSATVNITNGNPPYQYEWNNGDTNATAENLLPGHYEVTVTDAFGQQINGFVIVPNGTPLPEIDLQTTPDGQIEITGINPEVQYLWNGQENSAITALTPGEHTLELSNPMGCSKAISVWVADISTNVILEGAYDKGSLLMNNNLQQLGLVPLTDPYTGRMTTTETVLQNTGHAAIVDWVLLELHAENPVKKVVSSYPALLRRDGEIVANDGISPIRIAVPEETDYYIIIKHRNHLPVKSTNTVTFTQPAVTKDFEAGNNSRQKQLSNGSHAMYAADITGEHTIDGEDKIIWSALNGTFYQYHPADTNLDGDINGLDKLFWSINNGVFTDIE